MKTIQKVISVNVDVDQTVEPKTSSDYGEKMFEGYYEIEFLRVNECLAEGYKIIDRIFNILNANKSSMNITFILEKEV